MESIGSVKDQDIDYLLWTMFSFMRKVSTSIIGLNPVDLFWNICNNWLYIHEIMKIIASIKNRDMFWILFSFPEIFTTIESATTWSRKQLHQLEIMIWLLGFNHLVFLEKFKIWMTWFEAIFLLWEKSIIAHLVWLLLYFPGIIDSMFQQDHRKYCIN